MLILSGASTLIGGRIAPVLRNNFQVYAFDDDRGNVSDLAFLRSLVDETAPCAFVYCTPAFDPAACAYNPEFAYHFNAKLPSAIAALCRECGIGFMMMSSSHVFGGRGDSAHRETDAPDPISPFGDSLALGERLVLESLPDALIVRIPELCHSGNCYIGDAARALLANTRVAVIRDWNVSPTSPVDCGVALAELIQNGHQGLMNFSSAGSAPMRTVLESVAEELSALVGHEPLSLIDPVCADEYLTPFDIPLNDVLDTTAYVARTGASLRPWQETVRECVREIAASRQQAL